jgi:acyl-CoA thioester hydrolase
MTRIKVELPDEFDFTTEITIRISEINRGRHLGYAAVLPILEEAGARFFNSLGYREDHIEDVGIIVSDAAIIYKRQSYYRQTLKVEIAVTDIARKGFSMVFKVTDSDNGQEQFRAKIGYACFDYAKQQLTGVPENFWKKYSHKK